MLLSRKVLFKEGSDPNLIILRHMGYSAAKLWNVANYQKRNYKALNIDQFPNWYEQKKNLKDHFFYKNLPSQSAQDVLQELQEAWSSYFALLKTKGIENPRPPRFKKDVTGFTFLKGAIKQLKRSVRLTIPKQLKEYLKTQGLDANYIYLKTNRFSDIQIKEQYKLLLEGIMLIRQKEHYTSQCSPNSPIVSKKYAQKNNRKKRGLYVDGSNIFNADCVGAYNILRLYLSGTNKNCPDHKNLSSPVKVTV